MSPLLLIFRGKSVSAWPRRANCVQFLPSCRTAMFVQTSCLSVLSLVMLWQHRWSWRMDCWCPPAGYSGCGQGGGRQGAQLGAGMGAEPHCRQLGVGAASGACGSDHHLCATLVAGCPAETHPRASGHRGRVRATSAKLQPWTLVSTPSGKCSP